MSFTPEQIRAIHTVHGNVCVDAGAGSGKTRVLVEHMLYLIERGHATLDEIAAITFTDKAASELKTRLRQAFHARGNAALHDPEEMTRWRRLERRVETARVSTIHSFCISLLRENALRLGMDPDFAVLTEAESYLLQSEVVERTLHDLLDHADESAVRLAAEHGAARLTRVLMELLTRRPLMNEVLAGGRPSCPAELLASWTTKAADAQREHIETLKRSSELAQLRERLLALDGMCTVPSDLAEQLRRTMLEQLDRVREARDPESVGDAIRSVLGLKAQGGSAKNWSSDAALREVKNILTELRAFLAAYAFPALESDTEEQAAQLTCDLANVYLAASDALDAAKMERAAQDFDDVILKAVRMLREHPDIAERVRRGIKHLLIDEFQDTDHRQLELARILASGPGGPRWFIVGDAKQSIYGFRGAEVEVFAEARTEAETVVPLDTNFRSLPSVLAFVNDFFSRTGLLCAVEAQYRGLAAHRQVKNECVIEVLVPEENEEEGAQSYREAEAMLIAARIADMCCGPRSVTVCDASTGEDRPARFGDVAMLFRSLRDVYLYEKQLREAGIPYTLEAGEGFFEQQEVKDVCNVLNVVADPWNEIALVGFLRSPMAGLSDDALVKLCSKSGAARAFLAGEALGDEKEEFCWRKARELIGDLRAHSERPLPYFLRYLLDRTGYEAVLLRQFLGVRKAANVRKILDLAEGFSRTRSPKLRAFVRYLDETAAEGIREGEAPLQSEGARAVRLMTIHKAKGLEFPIVVVPDLSRGVRTSDALPYKLDREHGLAVQAVNERGEPAKPWLFEWIRTVEQRHELAEHWRILYVAMTRARDRLLLGGSPRLQQNEKTWMSALEKAYGILALEDGEQFGGEGWRGVIHRRPPATANIVTLRDVEDKKPAPREQLVRQAAPLAVASRGRKLFAVTELLHVMVPDDAPRVQGSSATSPASGEVLAAEMRGTLVHELLERWDFREPPAPLAEILCRDRYPWIRDPALWGRQTAALAERLLRTSIGQALQSRQIEREAPFFLRVDDVLVSGVIDALLEDGVILDYKTGRRTETAHERYTWQVRLYAAATRRLLGKEPPAAYLCYLDAEADESVVCSVSVSRTHVDEALHRAAEAVRHLTGG